MNTRLIQAVLRKSMIVIPFVQRIDTVEDIAAQAAGQG
jgi:hypothetical protein